MPDRTPNPFNAVFDWFVKDFKSAAITCLIVAVTYQWYQNGQLMEARVEDRDNFKNEIVKELKDRYDPGYNQMRDTVLAKSSRLDTSIENLNEFVNDQKNKKK